jgi:hypothetical protein
MERPAGGSVPSALLGAGLCGLVSVGALALVFASLSKDQVPGPYDGGDGFRALVGGLGAALAVVGVLTVLVTAARNRFGVRWTYAHVPLPLVLLPVVLAGVALPGGERNRLETGVLWGAAVLIVHLLVGLAGSAGRSGLAGSAGRGWWLRVVSVLGIVLTCAAAFGVTVASQHRWRAQKFEAVGLPLYVPDVPGYRLTGARAGRSAVILMLSNDPVHPRAGGRIDVWIFRDRDGRFPRCGPGSVTRWAMTDQRSDHGLVFCLPEPAVMTLAPVYGTPGIADLLPAVAVRKVTGSELARYPDDGTTWEAD